MKEYVINRCMPIRVRGRKFHLTKTGKEPTYHQNENKSKQELSFDIVEFIYGQFLL